MQSVKWQRISAGVKSKYRTFPNILPRFLCKLSHFSTLLIRMTEKSIANALKDVRRALLDADVNLGVADTLIEGVKNRSVGQEVTKGVTADQQFIKAMYDELLDMMGGDSSVQPAKATAGPPSCSSPASKHDKLCTQASSTAEAWRLRDRGVYIFLIKRGIELG